MKYKEQNINIIEITENIKEKIDYEDSSRNAEY